MNEEFRNLHKDDFSKIVSMTSGEMNKETNPDNQLDGFEIEDVKNSKYLIY